MKTIENRIRRAVETNKLSLNKLGKRNWYEYFINVTELVWTRNLHEGYLIDVYDEEYGQHLAKVIV